MILYPYATEYLGKGAGNELYNDLETYKSKTSPPVSTMGPPHYANTKETESLWENSSDELFAVFRNTMDSTLHKK